MLTLYQISLETFGVVISPGVAAFVFVFVALESVADVAEPQASVDIAFLSPADAAEPQVSAGIVLAFHVSVPVSVSAVEADSPGRPRSYAYPNIDYYSSFASSC